MSDCRRLYIRKDHALFIFIHDGFAIFVVSANNLAKDASIRRQILYSWVAEQSREERFQEHMLRF